MGVEKKHGGEVVMWRGAGGPVGLLIWNSAAPVNASVISVMVKIFLICFIVVASYNPTLNPNEYTRGCMLYPNSGS